MKVGRQMNMLDLTGKTAIVTGANQGIGKAIAEKLASNGVKLLLVDINENIHHVSKEIEAKTKGKIFSFQADLTDEKSISRLVEYAGHTLSSIDILVNNAGIMQTKPFMEITGEDWDNVLTINLKSMFLLSQQIVKDMLAKEKVGSIINVSSIAGRSGRPLAPHYAASKAGVISLTKSMAEAFGKQQIRTNAICPGVIKTPMIDEIYAARKAIGDSNNVEEKFLQQIKLNRLGTSDDIANTVLFLSSPLSDYINGQAINICGGYEMD